MEDDDYVAPAITKWLSQDLVILFKDTVLTGLQRLIEWLVQLQAQIFNASAGLHSSEDIVLRYTVAGRSHVQ